MTFIPADPDALLTRDDTAAALTEAGFPVKPRTLATKASRGSGPIYKLFGNRPLYRWGDALRWAEQRLTSPSRPHIRGGRRMKPTKKIHAGEVKSGRSGAATMRPRKVEGQS